MTDDNLKSKATSLKVKQPPFSQTVTLAINSDVRDFSPHTRFCFLCCYEKIARSCTLRNNPAFSFLFAFHNLFQVLEDTGDAATQNLDRVKRENARVSERLRKKRAAMFASWCMMITVRLRGIPERTNESGGEEEGGEGRRMQWLTQRWCYMI